MVGVAGVDRGGNVPGGVTHVGAMEQDSPVHSLSLHLLTQAGQPLRSHPAQVEHSRTLPGRRHRA